MDDSRQPPRDEDRPIWPFLAYHGGWERLEYSPPADGIPGFSRLSPDFFFITLVTERFAPNHTVTLLNSWDGWDAEVIGAYYAEEDGQGGKWVFALPPARYPKSFEIRFLLDHARPMLGDARKVDAKPGTAAHFFEGDIQFPPVTPKFAHGYDNLTTTRTKIQQDAVPGNFDETILYDVVIIGSGMGGGVLADALTDRHQKRVLVLDAGSLVFPTQVDNLPGNPDNLAASWNFEVRNYVNRPGSTLMFGVQMNLGGRSVFWEGLIPRMHGWELAHWPAKVGAYLASRVGYPRAERLLRKCRTLGTYQDALVKELRSEFLNLRVTDLPRSVHQPNLRRRPSASPWSITEVRATSTGVFSTADLLLDSLSFGTTAGKDNLTINLNHLVTGIETAGTLATQVVCHDLIGGVERKYRGKVVVLAAGSLESPRIAMASGLTDPNSKIGVGLTDHPAFFCGGFKLPKSSPYSGTQHHAKILLWPKGGAAHPYNIELLINPQYWLARHADDDVYQRITDTKGETWVSINFTTDSALNDANRLHYMGKGAKLEVESLPNMSRFHLRSEMIAVRNHLLDFLGATYNPADDIYHGNLGTVHHAGGSLRMSATHAGVVDENLKFEAYTNLYCCDVSVFPRIPIANPSLTLVALAQRLADHLATVV